MSTAISRELAMTAIAQEYSEQYVLAHLKPAEGRALDRIRAALEANPHWQSFVSAVLEGWEPGTDWLSYPHRDMVIGWVRSAGGPRGPLVTSRMERNVAEPESSIPHIPTQKGAAWPLPR